MGNFLQFPNLLDALLNARFSQTLLAFKVVINSSWKRFKVPVDKTELLLQLQAFPTAKLRINIPNAVSSFRYLSLKKLFSMKRKEYP